jgi:putative Mg2+ transporter-C (MgtC) family protein
MQGLSLFWGRTLQGTNATTVAAVVTRLLVAASLGAVIGIERQLKHRPAGLRTNMFMCFGAALFTIASGLIAHGGTEDTRIAAQIVTGIGFLGAGVIMHSGASVQGVTTAATIFVVAAIGMCAGSGLMIPAVLATIIVVFGLFVLGIAEEHVFGALRIVLYQLTVPCSADVHGLLAEALKQPRARLIQMKINGQHDAVQAEFLFEAKRETQQDLQKKLRQELDTNNILAFNISAQE